MGGNEAGQVIFPNLTLLFITHTAGGEVESGAVLAEEEELDPGERKPFIIPLALKDVIVAEQHTPDFDRNYNFTSDRTCYTGHITNVLYRR